MTLKGGIGGSTAGQVGARCRSIYCLVPLLHSEAQLLQLQMKLVSEKKLKRYHRQRYHSMQGKIFKLWDEYAEGKRSSSQFLRACSNFTGL